MEATVEKAHYLYMGNGEREDYCHSMSSVHTILTTSSPIYLIFGVSVDSHEKPSCAQFWVPKPTRTHFTGTQILGDSGVPETASRIYLGF